MPSKGTPLIFLGVSSLTAFTAFSIVPPVAVAKPASFTNSEVFVGTVIFTSLLEITCPAPFTLITSILLTCAVASIPANFAFSASV